MRKPGFDTPASEPVEDKADVSSSEVATSEVATVWYFVSEFTDASQ